MNQNFKDQLLDLIPSLLDITRDAGMAIMSIYDHDEDFGIEHKADTSPLTMADKASNDIICSRLRELDMSFPIISEENQLVDYSERKTWDYCWLVDPLDGTKEFIRRNGDFTVNIALVEKGEVILGVVGIPAHQEIYWAVKGHGAHLVMHGESRPVQAADFSETDSGLKIVCSRSHLNQETSDFLTKYKDPELVSRGSALKFLLLAKGEAHLYPRIAPTMEWDTAAAQIILEEAGGKVLVYETGEPLRYNRENLRNPSFVAYGKRISRS